MHQVITLAAVYLQSLLTLLTFLLFVFVHVPPNGKDDHPRNQSSRVWKLPRFFAVLELLDSCKAHSWHLAAVTAVSQLTVTPMSSNTSPSPNTRASASVCMGGTCPGLSYTHPQCSLGEGGGSRFNFLSGITSSWEVWWGFLSVSSSGKACTTLPQRSSPLTFHSLSLPPCIFIILIWQAHER